MKRRRDLLERVLILNAIEFEELAVEELRRVVGNETINRTAISVLLMLVDRTRPVVAAAFPLSDSSCQ